ncbi:MAG: hypothetical protein PUC18_12525 [Prevotellaceae bacterium]|nr:hypothetical protein [Prevotellaceae bacterium]
MTTSKTIALTLAAASALVQECAIADMKQEFGDDYIEMEVCNYAPTDMFDVF